MARKPPCVCGCGRRAANRHHVIYQQELRKHGGDPKDARNLVWVAWECHQRQHSGHARLLLPSLPDSVFEFAAELMGPAAYDYLRTHYWGRHDPRLDALLAEAA